ncbi:protein of unknown function [Magnetospira sp. QH-2]|nr:protein of unknown function [Magnetospira sp. QH-2]
MTNILIGVAVVGISTAWVIGRLRAKVDPKSYFLCADYIEDRRDFRLYHEVAEGGPVLLAERHSSWTVRGHEELNSYDVCQPKDGLFDLLGGLKTLGMIFRDGLKLLMGFNDRPPALFYQIATLPFRRAVLRGFFNRFHPSYHWSRDDYNVEHILRRQELHRVGGTALGINHGYSHYSNFYPMWRYISFDRFYVFGRAQYDRYTHQTWAKDMVIVPSGTFGASRQDYRSAHEPKPKDIAVFVAPFIDNPEMIRLVRGLAEAFIDRKILLQVKGTFVDTDVGKDFVRQCQDGMANVVHTRDRLFDIFTQARYAFSDPSTVVVEAMQFGLFSFMTDLCPYQKVSLHREFPGLCVNSPGMAVTKIKSIEDGSQPYPLESYRDLVDLSGRVLFDIVRSDMGLVPLEKERPFLMSS